MNWMFFAFLTAIFFSLATIAEKKTLRKEHAMEFAAVLALFNFLLTSPLLFFINYDAITPKAWGLLYLASLLGSVAFLFIAKAVRHIPITIASPLLTFDAAFVAMFAFLFLGEKLTLVQVSGLLLLVSGTYLLETAHKGHWLDPFKKLWNSKYVHYLFFGILVYGIANTIDKKILGSVIEGGLGVPAITYIPLVHAFIAVNFITMIKFFHDGFKGIKHGVQNAGILILLVSLLTLFYRLTQAHALTFEGAKVAIVIAIRQTSALFSTFFGGELFHEQDLLRKTISCGVMVAGAIIILS